MSTLNAEIEGASIVLRGNFNPSIFQPAWFARHQLVRDAEANDAKIEIIRPEISIFTIGVVNFRIDADTFVIQTVTAEAFDPIRDIVLGTFRLLEHTPIAMLGINRQMHFRMSSEEKWHKVGHKLAPKEIWQDLLANPGTKSVVIQGQRPNSQARFLMVTIEPSKRIQPGVYVATNEHFEKQTEQPSSALLDLLSSNWEESLRNSKVLAEKLLQRCLEEPHA